MPYALHEHMNLYLEELAKLDPRCMRCGEPAHWQMQGVGHLQMLRPPEILCQRCLSGVDPVRVPVYSDPPAKIPMPAGLTRPTSRRDRAHGSGSASRST